MRRGTSPAQRSALLSPRQRWLAWIGFVLLAGYAPVVAWLKPDDTWLMPVAVAGVIGYVLVIDDVLRRRGAPSEPTAQPIDDGTGDAQREQTPTRSRRVDDPGSGVIHDAPMRDQRPDR